MTSFSALNPVAARIAACLATDLPGDLSSAQAALLATVQSWDIPCQAEFAFDLTSTENYVGFRGTVDVDGKATVEFGGALGLYEPEYLLDLDGLLDYIEARVGGMPPCGYCDVHSPARALKSSLFFNPSPELLEKFSNEFFWEGEGEGVSSVAGQIGGWLYIAQNFDEACAKAEAYVDRVEKV